MFETLTFLYLLLMSILHGIALLAIYLNEIKLRKLKGKVREIDGFCMMIAEEKAQKIMDMAFAPKQVKKKSK